MNRFQLSLSYAVAYGSTFEDFIARASEIGFSSVQLIPDQTPNLYSEIGSSRIERLRDLRRQLGISYHVHNVFYDINLTSLVPRVKECAFEITEEVVNLACALEAQTVTLHPGYMFGGWRRDPVQRKRFWNEAENSMRRLGELSVRAGIPLLIENGSYHITTADGKGRTPLHLGITPDETKRLVDYSESKLGVCLDVGKAFRSGHSLQSFLTTLGSSIQEIQASTVTTHKDALLNICKEVAEWKDYVPVILEGSESEALAARSILSEAS